MWRVWAYVCDWGISLSRDVVIRSDVWGYRIMISTLVLRSFAIYVIKGSFRGCWLMFWTRRWERMCRLPTVSGR